MADSTWFHGSQWPPSNHGIIPSWRWTAAIDAAVATTSCALEHAGHLGERRTDGPVDELGLDVGAAARRGERSFGPGHAGFSR